MCRWEVALNCYSIHITASERQQFQLKCRVFVSEHYWNDKTCSWLQSGLQKWLGLCPLGFTIHSSVLLICFTWLILTIIWSPKIRESFGCLETNLFSLPFWFCFKKMCCSLKFLSPETLQFDLAESDLYISIFCLKSAFDYAFISHSLPLFLSLECTDWFHVI